MATEIVLPQWSMGMADGTIVRWLKQEGDQVREGEPLAEVEAAKVTSEVEAEVSGVLVRILVAAGETVPVRTPLCLIGTADEVRATTERASTPAEEERTSETTSASGGERLSPPAVSAPLGVPSGEVTPVARRLAKEHGIDLSQVRGSGPGGRITVEDVQQTIEMATRPGVSESPTAPVQIVPAARRLAKEHGIDLSQVRGSGPGGRITVEDVQQAIEIGARPTASAPPVEQVIPLTGMRAAIARRMHQSLQTMAQLTLTTEVDVTALVQLREELKQDFALTYTDLIVKAVAHALKSHPRLNAWMEGESIRLVQDIHIGVAVALDDGLIVPVVQHVERKSLREIAQETRSLVERAREGKLTREEVTGSTFTVTNLGMYGVDAFTPIISPPEVAILGIGRIVEKLVRVPHGAMWRQMMTLSLTFDHRVVDGVPAASFLQAVSQLLENPSALTA